MCREPPTSFHTRPVRMDHLQGTRDPTTCALLIWDGAAKGPACHRASTWLQMPQDGEAALLIPEGP